MTSVVIVSFHAPAEPSSWAEEFAARAVGDRLAAGVNVMAGVRSVFWWRGEPNHEDEILVEVTTTAELVADVTERVIAEHPYELPGVRSIVLDGLNDEFRRWVADSTRS